MITLIIRLCAICAVCSLLELASTGSHLKGSLRFICGMIMLSITISQIQAVAGALVQQTDLVGIFECLMR